MCDRQRRGAYAIYSTWNRQDGRQQDNNGKRRDSTRWHTTLPKDMKSSMITPSNGSNQMGDGAHGQAVIVDLFTMTLRMLSDSGGFVKTEQACGCISNGGRVRRWKSL